MFMTHNNYVYVGLFWLKETVWETLHYGNFTGTDFMTHNSINNIVVIVHK